ncbi:MAG: hypothetical protein ACYC4N_20325, partial [Pirellulaceae bacterium]
KIWTNLTTMVSKGILNLVAQFDILNTAFGWYSGVDYQAEIARAQALGNDPNMALNTLDQQNQDRQRDVESETVAALLALEAETAKLRDQYEQEKKAISGSVDQAIAMAKLPDKLVEDEVKRVNDYKYEGSNESGPMGSLIAKSMPEGLERGSTDAAKAAFDNRKASLDAALKTANNTAKIAEGITTIVKRGGFIIEGVGSSFTTAPGG